MYVLKKNVLCNVRVLHTGYSAMKHEPESADGIRMSMQNLIFARDNCAFNLRGRPIK